MGQVAVYGGQGNFCVKDQGGRVYPATFLTQNGVPVANNVLQKNFSPYSPLKIELYTDSAGTLSFPNKNNYLVVPSADYMSNVQAVGQQYGNALHDASVSDANGDFAIAAQLRTNADGLLANFAPKIGSFDAQYQSTLGAILDTGAWISHYFDAKSYQIPAFTDAGNYGVGIFFGTANRPVDDALSTCLSP